MKIKRYNEFETREEYIRYVRKSLSEEGLKCMVLSIAILLLIFLIGEDTVQEITGLHENMCF